MAVKKVKISELPLYPETEPEDRVSIPGADGDNKTYRVTMDRLKGDTGAVFTPSVDAEGNLSWINDKGLENPSPANIRGPKGDIGDTGLTGKSVHSLMTDYDVPLSQWKLWLDETTEYSGYNVPDTAGVNVGDTVILHGKISDLGNTPCYFVGEVTRIESATRLCVRTPLHLFYGMENGDIYARQRSGNDLIQYSNEFNFASDDCKGVVVNHRRGSGKSDGGIREYSFNDGGGNLADIRAKHFMGKASRLGTDNEYSAYVASWHSHEYIVSGILIKLPYKCDTDAMFAFDVLVHAGYEISHYTVGGYLYSTHGSIYGAKAVLKSGTGSFARHVTMGSDAQGNAYVWISSPVNDHPAVTITDVMTHWRDYDWSEGWEVKESDGSAITRKDFDADLYPPASIQADNMLVSHGNEFNFANETCSEVFFNYRRGNGVGSGGINSYLFCSGSGANDFASVQAANFYLPTAGPVYSPINLPPFLGNFPDSRNVVETPNSYNGAFIPKGIKYAERYGIGDSNTFVQVFGYRGHNDPSGGHAHEFALSDSGRIYHRKGSTDSWNAWDTVAYMSDLNSSETDEFHGRIPISNVLIEPTAEEVQKKFLRAQLFSLNQFPITTLFDFPSGTTVNLSTLAWCFYSSNFEQGRLLPVGEYYGKIINATSMTLTLTNEFVMENGSSISGNSTFVIEGFSTYSVYIRKSGNFARKVLIQFTKDL